MLIYLIFSLSAYLFSRIEQYALSGFVLILAAVYLYIKEYEYSKSLVNLRGIFSLAFVGGEGLSAMKLSYLAKPWNIITWLCISLAFICFYAVFNILKEYGGNPYINSERVLEKSNENRMYACIIIIALVSAVAFNIEAIILGFIPFFERGVPHAYSYFHISGVHYFTVSCVLIPALSIIYLHEEGKLDAVKLVFLSLANIIAIIIPILCVSRFQFMFAVLLAFITFLILKREKIKPIYFIMLIVVIVPVYLLLSVLRSHDVEYLNGIFEMKYKFPIYISQPYIYIANNYDNLDTLIKKLPNHSLGMKGLFPLWALTGLKFVYPKLVDFPIFVNKTELTTVTLFYDAFYDFGIIGVGVFSAILGAVIYMFEKWIRSTKHAAFYMIYAQFFIYMALSFFTTWFSNPATWFYFIVTVAIFFICEQKGKQVFRK